MKSGVENDIESRALYVSSSRASHTSVAKYNCLEHRHVSPHEPSEKPRKRDIISNQEEAFKNSR